MFLSATNAYMDLRNKMYFTIACLNVCIDEDINGECMQCPHRRSAGIGRTRGTSSRYLWVRLGRVCASEWQWLGDVFARVCA